MKYTQTPAGKIYAIVPPNIVAMMTGVAYVSQAKDGMVTLHYSDGQKQSAHCEKDISEFDFMKLVGFVQGKN